MTDTTLLARARKARYDDSPSFSGQLSEDPERFLKSIKNISKADNNSTDPVLLEIVRGKLTQNAGAWFDDNESQFTKWSEFETAFRNRYFSTDIINTKLNKLSQRKQRHDESVITYFDDVTSLCREVDSKMSDITIIQHLMKGINPEFRKELTRRQTEIKTLAEFLQFAKLEQDLHDTFTQFQETSLRPEPYPMCLLSSQNNQRPPRDNLKYGQRRQPTPYNQSFSKTTNQSSNENWNSPTNTSYNASTHKQTPEPNQRTTSTEYSRTQQLLCKICGKQNHRSIDCKKGYTSGCYNCGQRHAVRDCPDPPHFQ